MGTNIVGLLQDVRALAGDAVLLEAGRPASVVTDNEAKQLSDQSVTPDEIHGFLALAIPPDRRSDKSTVPNRFHIKVPGGHRYEVTVTPHVPAPRLALQFLKPEAPVEERTTSPLTLRELLKAQLAQGASDLHLCSGVHPMVRKDGEMRRLEGFPDILTAAQLKTILFDAMPARNLQEFKEHNDTDFAVEYSAEARFRCNVFSDRNGIGSVLRVIPTKIRTAEELGLSKHVLDLCFLTKGLVVVTGPTGSGKSTTLAGMVDYINQHRADHIITIEDPIEFVHPNKKCLVNQREIHTHTDSFKQALRAALREDPDIVLLGEMRDLETIAIALETAETGHLVFGTLHTNTAPSTVDRIIDQFPADQQSQVRVMLAEALKGVVAQTLCKKIGGGRVAALEVLVCDHAVANLIREGKTMQIASIMQTGKAKGNITLNDSLIDLVKRKVVEPQEAFMKAVDKAGFQILLNREGFGQAPAGGKMSCEGAVS